MKKQSFSVTSKLFPIQMKSNLKSLHHSECLSQNVPNSTFLSTFQHFLLYCYGPNNLTECSTALLRALNKDLRSMNFHSVLEILVKKISLLCHPSPWSQDCCWGFFFAQFNIFSLCFYLSFYGLKASQSRLIGRQALYKFNQAINLFKN